MKKIGIITLNGYINYGNRLQNYALQETLKKFNYKVETIWIDNKKKKKDSVSKTIKLVQNPKLILKKVYRKFYLNPLKVKRENRFRRFSDDYINETKYSISENYLPKELLNEYKYYVTGSDQVWNPFYIKGSPLYFLTFVPESKRISYAASFGISDIPKDYIDNYTKWLSEMRSISVREKNGAEIVKTLTDRNVPVVVDPTLLLTKEDWLVITKPSKNKPEKDILLTYFLGEIPKSIQSKIKKYKRKYKLEVVNLANPKYKNHYFTDPAEFLDYIYSAKLFFTDSFHGAVFSVLFETPFVVANRKSKTPSMNSRIETLLHTFKLESRHVDNIKEKEILDVDFSHTFDILASERNRAFDFLNKSINKSSTELIEER